MPSSLGSAGSPPAGKHPGVPIDMSCKMVAAALPIEVPRLPQPLVEILLVNFLKKQNLKVSTQAK